MSCPPKCVEAWNTALYNMDSSTENNPPNYEEAVPNDGYYVAVDGVYTEMDYHEEPVPRTSWWSKKRVIMLVTFLLVLFVGITCSIIFPMGLVLKSDNQVFTLLTPL